MITERAKLAAVHISIWTAVKHDRKVSRRCCRSAWGTSERRSLQQAVAARRRQAGRATIAGWPDPATFLQDHASVVGRRLPPLPSNFYFDLMERMREFEASFEQGVESFLTVYPQYIDQVRPELNGLFREEDYPSVEKLRTKFGVKLEILPIPSGADFRVQMSAEEQARVSREIDANVRQSFGPRHRRPMEAPARVVSHMVDRLNEPDSRFHGLLVTNVFDLVEILPRLNVQGRRRPEPVRRTDQATALQLLGAGPQEA